MELTGSVRVVYTYTEMNKIYVQVWKIFRSKIFSLDIFVPHGSAFTACIVQCKESVGK